ncbi:chromate transporter, partial [Acinetobacter baumannii]
RATIAAVAAGVVLLVPGALAQVAVMAVAALLGRAMLRTAPAAEHVALPIAVDRRFGALLLVLFAALLVLLPLAARAWAGQALALTDAFYR